MLTDQWRKSSRSSTNGSCVEVRLIDDTIEVRNSNDPTGPTLKYTRAEWDAFIPGTKDGEFDLV